MTYSLSPGNLERFISKTNLTDDYFFDKVIGSGGYSIVRLGFDKRTGEKVALKMIFKEKAYYGMNLFSEVQLLRALGNHENINRAYGLYDFKEYYVIVMEYVKDGELLGILLKHFENGGIYSEAEIAIVMYQVIKAIAHCHKKNVIHRDIKPDNILVNDDARMGEPGALKTNPIKLCDFGMAAILTENGTLAETCGTPEYMSPERLRGANYNEKSDIWSSGVLLYILIAGSFPFFGENVYAIREKTESLHYPIINERMKNISKDCIALMNCMLAKNPEERPSAQELLNHPWLTGKTAKTCEIEGAVAALRKFNARRKLRMCINGVIARNRMHFLLIAIKAEACFVKLTINESFTFDDLRLLYDNLTQYSENEKFVSREKFLQAFEKLEIRDMQIPKKLFKLFANGNTLQINIQDFCLSLGSKLQNCDSHELYDFAFDIFDINKNGGISKYEFCECVRGILSQTDEVPSKEWLLTEFEEADVDKSGELSKDEFRKVCENNIKFKKYLKNCEKFLKFKKDVFEEKVAEIRHSYSGMLFLKRQNNLLQRTLISKFTERNVLYEPKSKTMKLSLAYSSRQLPVTKSSRIHLNDGVLTVTPKKKPLKLLKISLDNPNKSRFRFTLHPTDSRGPICWEYATHQEEQAWIDTFKETGVKLDLFSKQN
ncbi:uncharacterized protein LOC135129342 [Zophobas morio]|jgi:calcium-dependent protein kinase|uniref:uncharacterized protein LOC135129342 n=1 Tax=Zophobas morio TaxID=2755281 RepID=UPI003083828C